MSWQGYFQEHILARGYHYFIENRVEILEKEKDYIRASVRGTENYDVEAVLDDGRIIALDCTCPYAADDNFCKHMAAVMFAYEGVDTGSKKPTQKTTVEELVNQADDDYIRAFLIDLLAADPSLLHRFRLDQQNKMTQVDVDYYKTILLQIFDDYLYPNAFIDYDEAWAFESDIDHFLNETIRGLFVQHGHHQAAFELTTTLVLKLIDLSIDDSGGALTHIAFECYAIWEQLLERPTQDLQREMFAWFTHVIETKELDFMEDFIETFFFSHFKEDAFMKKKIAFIKKQLETIQKNEQGRVFIYRFDKWARYYLESLEAFDELEAEQNAFIKEHLAIHSVRAFYVDKLIAAKEYEDAISLLEEERVRDDGYLSDEYLEKLKDLYLKTDNRRGYQSALYDMLRKHGSSRIDLWQDYKAEFNEEEWTDKRKDLLKEISVWNGKDELLFEEKMYEELLELAVTTSGLSMIEKYEKLFRKMDSEKVLDKYETEILKKAETTSNRKTYRFINDMIRQMNRLPNSTKRVKKLLVYLRETYNNRPAMMDELRDL